MIRLATSIAAALVLAGCATPPAGLSATATLAPTTGNAVKGQVRFTQQGDKVVVSGEVSGLKPNAEHGFHLYDKGDCSSGDGMSTGGHYNPGAVAHGAHDHSVHHAGDLPGLKADSYGVARINFETTALSVGGAKADVIGHGLIVHRDPDDFKTQPTGHAGPRVACAVVTKG
jgi:superoxide dismutase, Cu-Zn family